MKHHTIRIACAAFALAFGTGTLGYAGDSSAAAPTHLSLTRQELAAFVLGTRPPSEADPLSQLDRVLDRSHLMPPGAVESVMKGMKAAGDFEH